MQKSQPRVDLTNNHVLTSLLMASMADVQRLVDKIARLFHPEKIVLFGSYAPGKPRPDSDVDLFMVMVHQGHPAQKAAEIISQVHPGSFSVDLIVRSPETLQKRAQMNDWFIREVLTEGRVMYAA